MLAVHNLSKRYGEQTALHPLTLQFPAGQTLALLGPSGCGKSTLLRLLMGLIQPDAGEVLLDGVKLEPSNIRPARHRMGYMIQDGGLFPHLTISGNVTLLARRLGWPPDRIAARAKELAALTHLPEAALSRFPREVSGGQRQRVALMRALFLDPDVVLLDEPMGSLDPLIRSGLQAELRQIFVDLAKTVVLVTHDIGEAGFLADEIALMRGGRILQRGSLHELAKRPADPFVREFLQAQRGPLDSLEL